LGERGWSGPLELTDEANIVSILERQTNQRDRISTFRVIQSHGVASATWGRFHWPRLGGSSATLGRSVASSAIDHERLARRG